MNISQGMGWMKTLKERHNELLNLRNENAKRVTRLLGAKEYVDEPTYDVKALDKLVVAVAKEIRLLDEAIKNTNAITELKGYTKNEDVLGNV